MHDDATRMLATALKRRKNVSVALTPETVTESPTGGLAVIGAGGEPVEVRNTTDWTPLVGDQILTLRVGESVWAIGPVTNPQPPPPVGTVASVTGGTTVTVALGAPFGNMVMPSLVTVTAGQLVGVTWHQNGGGKWLGFVNGVLPFAPGQAPPPPPPPPTEGDRPGGDTGLQTLRVPAIATGSVRQGVMRGDTTHLYQGNAGSWSSWPYPQSGFWFYGAGAFDDHKGHDCQSITMDVRVIDNAGVRAPVNVRFRRHTSPTKTTGQPTLLPGEHVVSLAPGRHKVTLDESWGQDLIDGVAAGIAIVATSTAEYRGIHGLSASPGVSADPQSGHLTITSS